MKPNTIDLEKMARQLLEDLKAFKEDGLEQQIAVMYLYQAFKSGDKNGWWQQLDATKAKMIETEEPFDSDFFHSDKYMRGE